MKPHFNEKYSLKMRHEVIRYFKHHTARECAGKFGTTHGQMISILEYSRRMGLLPKTFKDKRNKTPWSLDDILFVIRHAGVRPRAWIGRKLGRGGARVIKERLRLFNSGTKWLNGMPRKWAVELWGESNVSAGIKTDAGPSGGGQQFCFIIIPWTDCKRLACHHPTSEQVRIAIRSMAKFQSWIHGVNDPRWITRKLKGALNE